MKQILFIILPGLTLLLSVSCTPSDNSQEDGKMRIVCTTGMIGDAVAIIADDYAEVVTLMGPGVDPHLYKATQGDLRELTQASAIFYNGLHLEGKMGEVLEKLARQKPVLPVADGIDSSRLVNSTNFADAFDPHIWFDVELWADAVAFVGKELQNLDPEHAADYQARTETYLARLDSLHQTVSNRISTIPQNQRVLITAHDAFTYFGLAYDIEVRGLQGISTVSEYGLRDISELVDFITTRKIQAVFVESSVPTRSLEAVVEGCNKRGHAIEIGGTLYSDAMGAAGTLEGTYLGMVDHNVETIVEALK